MTHSLDPRLLLENAAWVRALARRLVGNEERADDVAQEAWLTALERPPRATATIRRWLRTVLTRIAHRSARGAERRRRREDRAFHAGLAPSPSDLVERAEIHRFLVGEVLALDEPYRSTILFHFFEGLSAEEIGLRAGVPAGTVRVRLHRALEKLRERLDARSGGDRANWLAVLAMTTAKTKWAVGAAIVLALCGVGWWMSTAPETREMPAAFGASARAPARSSDSSGGEPELRAREVGKEAAAHPRESITGLVVDSTGNPVGGAKIAALLDDAAETVPFDGPDARFRATADAAGRFGIAGFDPRRRYDVVASAPGVSAGSLVSVRPGSDVVLALAPACRLTGFVRDLAEQPVAGARVTWMAVVRGVRIEIATVSDERGAFRVEGVPATKDLEWATANLLVIADGFAPAFLGRATPETTGADFTRDVFLTTGATIRGRVVDAETGEPLGGARVAFASSEGVVSYGASNGVWRSSPFGPRPLGESIADEEGRFEFAHVPAWGAIVPGVSTLTSTRRSLGGVMASAPGFAPGAKSIDVPDPGAIVEIEIACWPGGRVTGRVVDDRGAPVANASVAAKNPECPVENGLARAWTHAVTWARTDSEGRYALDRVPARRGLASRIVVTALARQRSEGKADVVVTAGGDAVAPDIVCDSGAMAIVRVTDSAGEPIAGATIATGALGDREGSTDADGEALVEFAPEAVERGVPLPIFARAAGYAVGVSEPVMPEKRDPPTMARIVLEPEHRIRGRVRHENGAPPAFAFVTVASAATPLANCAQADGLGRDGSFEVVGLPPGPYHVSARANGGSGQGWIVGVASDVPTGATDVEVILANREEEPPRFELAGSVRDSVTGEPVYRVEVFLWREGSNRGGATPVDARGRFVLRDVEPDEWLLTVSSPGYLTHREPGIVVGPDAPDDRTLDIRLERGATLRGTIRTASGDRFVRATADFVTQWGSQSIDVALGVDGAFEGSGFRPGMSYAVFVRDERQDRVTRTWCTRLRDRMNVPESGDAGAREIEVVPSGGLVLRFRRELSLEERLRQGLGTEEGLAPQSGGRVEVATPDGFVVFDREVRGIDNFGLFVPEGPYVARFTASGREPVEKRVTAVAGESTTVDFSSAD